MRTMELPQEMRAPAPEMVLMNGPVSLKPKSVRNRSGIGQEGLGGLQPLLDEVLSEPEVPETVAEKEFGI